jgi:hypothetical protein
VAPLQTNRPHRVMSVMGIFRQLQIQGPHLATTKEKGRPRGQPLGCGCRRYSPFTSEQWVEAVFHVPESLTQVSLQITVRARCLPWSSAS